MLFRSTKQRVQRDNGMPLLTKCKYCGTTAEKRNIAFRTQSAKKDSNEGKPGEKEIPLQLTFGQVPAVTVR